MRIAAFGDVHANLEALRAVLADAGAMGCAQYVCIGDLVGYNANPRECVEIVRGLDCPVVRGDHDEEAASDSSLEHLNSLARKVMQWTRNTLHDEDKDWLGSLPMVRQVEDFTMVHATLDTPGEWSYVTNKFDAMASFSYQFTSVCFYGHTHSPKFYVNAGKVTEAPGPTVRVEPGKKYFVNVGSVGQPRDGDWRACYAIYDLETSTITIRRVDYDVGGAQDKLVISGLPPRLSPPAGAEIKDDDG